MRRSFVVNILYQENATWQGTVTWVDKNESKSFRSALELIRLIDSTMDDTVPTDRKEAPPEKAND